MTDNIEIFPNYTSTLSAYESYNQDCKFENDYYT